MNIHITDIKSEVLNFRYSGKIEGTYILQTEYKYLLLPFEPGIGLKLICQSDSIAELLIDQGSVLFNCRIIITFNTKNGKLPIPIDLIATTMIATDYMNQELKKILYSIEGMPVFEITPVNIEKTLLLMESCLQDAYPNL